MQESSEFVDAVEVKPAECRVVAVVGEMSFAGPAVVRALLERGLSVRALCPSEQIGQHLLDEKAALIRPETQPEDGTKPEPAITIVKGDIDSASAVTNAVKGAYGMCFLSPVTISGRTHRPWTHIDDVKRVIAASQNGAVRKLVYQSVLGAHLDSPSRAFQEAAEAEELVRMAKCEDYSARTGPLMGPQDSLLSDVIELVRLRFPITSIRGYGSTLLQPLHVNDMGNCLARIFLDKPSEIQPGILSLSGPQTITLLDLTDLISERLGRLKLKVHVPLFLLEIAAAARRNSKLKEEVSLLSESFYSPQNDAPRLLTSGRHLRTIEETLNELLPALINTKAA